MISKPLIVVAGATGNQGGSVVQYLLKDGGFGVRGLTSSPESERARELASKGVEIFKVDVDDFESVKKALTGAYGVFGITNFWNPKVGKKEVQHGRTMVDAAKAAGVKHFVWSTLDHTANPEVPHWNTKNEVDNYLKASGVPRTSLYTSFYYENFLAYFPLKRGPDSQLEADWPLLWTDGPIGIFAAEETGAYVTAFFKDSQRWIGQDARVVSEIVTPRQIVQWLSEVSGVPIKVREVSEEDFEKVKDVKPELYELWVNNKWFYVNNGDPGRDPKLSRELNPQLQSFREWATNHAQVLFPK